MVRDRVCGARFPNMPRYRKIYRLRSPSSIAVSAPTFFSPFSSPITPRILPRTSIRLTALLDIRYYSPVWETFLGNSLSCIKPSLERAQFPPRLIENHETKTSPKRRGRRREREREGERKKERYNRHTIHELWRQFRTRSRPTGRKPRTLRPPRIPPYRVATP